MSKMTKQTTKLELRYGQGWDENFTRVPNEEIVDTHLSPAARHLFTVLASHLNTERLKDGDNRVWPSQEYLAGVMNCTDRTIRNYLRELDARGWIDPVRQGRNEPNLYYIHAIRQDRGTDRKPVSDPPPEPTDRKPVSDPPGTGNQLPVAEGGTGNQFPQGPETSFRLTKRSEPNESEEQNEEVPPLAAHPAETENERSRDEPESKRSPKQRARDEMSNALLWVVFRQKPDQFEILSAESQSNVRKQATAWQKAGVSADDLRSFGDWWFERYWKGRDGDPPTFRELKDHWGMFQAYRRGLDHGGRRFDASDPAAYSAPANGAAKRRRADDPAFYESVAK